MASLLTKAAKGNRAALTRLYNQTKNDLFFLASELTLNSDSAKAAMIQTYKIVLNTTALKAIDSERDFKRFAEQTLVQQAKAQLTRHNPKALRLPADRRFDIRTVAGDVSDDRVEAVFATFTDLQRWVFVLHTATDMCEDELCAATKLDRRTLSDAMDAETPNVNKILGEDSFDDFERDFLALRKSTKVSYDTDEAVAAVIGEIVKPFEKAKKKRTVTTVLILLGICALLVGLSALLIWDMTRPNGVFSTSSNSSNSSSDTTTTTNAAQKNVGTKTSVTATHYAEIDIKDYGKITVALDSTTAPETVMNFLSLADSGFYDGLTFHRIMEDFMMQGGDPKGNGTGGSDKTITGEFASNGFDNPLSHVRGAISMARSNAYDSASSQFFIVHKDSTFLDGEYAVFGYVTEGMDVVDKICTEVEAVDDNGTIPDLQQPVINTITVRSAITGE